MHTYVRDIFLIYLFICIICIICMNKHIINEGLTYG